MFRQYAITVTERTIPTQVKTMCVVARGDKFRWIDLDGDQPRSIFVQQALRELKRSARSDKQ